MDPMNRISRSLASLIISQAILAIANAEPATVIPANEAAAHLANTRPSKEWLRGCSLPTKATPSSILVSKSLILSGIEGKHVKITGRIEMYKGKPESRIKCCRAA